MAQTPDSPRRPTSAGCVFCAIVHGRLPAHVIHDDDQTLAFLDVNPAALGHTLIVPKQHAVDMFTIDADSAAAVMRTAKVVADLIDHRLNPDGLTVVQTNRRAGWQDVFHLHVHLVPRWTGDDLKRPWTPRPATQEALGDVARTLKPAEV